MSEDLPEETTQSNKYDILADLWMNYRDDEEFKDFIEYNDLGLPLAYALSNQIVEPTPDSDKFINETFLLLLVAVGYEEDLGFDNLDDMLDF